MNRPTSSATNVANPITYKFEEANGEKLPSFALEQTLAKSSTLTTRTSPSGASEDTTFVRIATGNRVNTFTMTANENEEVKMTMDLNSSAVNALDIDEEMYARNNVAEVENFSNRKNAQAGHLEPFFFSDGIFSAFGHIFLKITNFTLFTILLL